MIAEDLIKYVESWAPPGAAWEKDNVGLQVGDTRDKIKNVLLALDLNKEVISQALKKNCNFIFTHHPFIFNPIKKLDFKNNPRAELIKLAVQKKLTIFSAHTNLDFIKDGVSFELAKILKLKNVSFLLNQESNQVKVVVFVPNDKVDKVSTAIFEAGGGIIGEYSNCSYRLEGIGTFKGSHKTNPAIGKKEKFEQAAETRLE
ncbi:MAG TPA: Nif3-like dinuclear metal center hexameric protein, partial [Ignavibacteria bacterium]|nr:Nif3-like dinuclear metal center hexameric protein [Ignavibacteria bacterium]